VDIKALQEVALGRIKWKAETSAEDFRNRFIVDPWNGKYHYFSGDWLPEASIYDPVPADVPKIPQKGMKNIIDFSDSHWKLSKKTFVQSTYDPSQPVYSAELIMTRRNFLEKNTEAERKQIFCRIAPQPLEASRLHPSVAATCLIWPAIIHRLEAYFIAIEATEKIGLHGIPVGIALEAFTKSGDIDEQEQIHASKVLSMGKNYERLEFIGDSLLKMMSTITVFCRTKCDEEGMHCRRMEILCNRRLFDVSTSSDFELFRYIRSLGFSRTTWYPELVLIKGRGAKKPPQKVVHEATHDLGPKTIADVSEACIGAAVVASRNWPNKFDLGIQAITKLVQSDDHAINSWDEIRSIYSPEDWQLQMTDPVANDLAGKVQKQTGYRFRYPRLLRSAFTHSSDMNSLVPDLQRLEFLGDACLDWVCIDWLFCNNPDRNPQWLTEHKMAMVSNKFLAALAVVLSFDKFFFANTTKLLADITRYAEQVREAYPLAKAAGRRDFWTDFDHPPKALSDLVESYIGAILVDSDWDYSQVENFFADHVLWFFENINDYDTFANRHPTSYIHKKLTDEYKCMDFTILSSDPKPGEIETNITAGVVVHGKVMASSKGTSSRYAKVRASQQALQLLNGVGLEEFREKWQCDCRRKGD